MQEFDAALLQYAKTSPEVMNYIAEGRYISLVQETGRTANDILMDCRTIVLDELEEMGVEAIHPEALIIDGYKFQAVLYLRGVLDEITMRGFLGRLSSSEHDRLKPLLDHTEMDAPFGLDLILDYMLGVHTNNPQLQFIREYSHEFLTHTMFYTRLSFILENTIPHEPDDTADLTQTIEFIKHKQEHIAYVRKAAEYLRKLAYSKPLDQKELTKRLIIHDRDLLSNESIREAASTSAIRKQKNSDPTMLKIAQDSIMNHYMRSKHHLSHWEGKEDSMTLVDEIEIISDIYDGQKTKQDFIDDLHGIFKKVQISEQTEERLMDLVNRFNIWDEGGKDEE